MPFSLYSYLLGVGTVVGALAFGFGGGVLLTNTAMKENPSSLTKMERVARSEPQPAPAQQVASAHENAAPPAAQTPAVNTDQAPAAQMPAVNTDQAPVAQAPVAQPAAAPAAGAEPPKANSPREAERVKEPVPAQPAEQASQPAEQAKQMEPKGDEQRKTTERKPERQKRYAERKSGDTTIARTKPRRLEVVDEPEEVAPAPQEQHFDLFKMPGLFGRPEGGNE